jgi:hypothetical protein
MNGFPPFAVEKGVLIAKLAKAKTQRAQDLKKTAHRKTKPQGGLSYSLAEVISLAFGLMAQAHRPHKGF